MIKKVLAVLLSVLVLLSAATMSVSAENLSGKCGEGVQWSLNTIRGDLTVYGHGAMDDYFTHDQPWGSNAKSIVSVEIGEGVTHIGDYAFSDTETAWVQLPQSLRTIGNYAFRSCDKLKSVSIPDGVRTLYLNAFDACTSLSSIHISRYTQTIIGGIDTKVTICSTSADCAAALYAAEKGYSFEVCTHAEHTHEYADTVTMPTCEQKGGTAHTCAICGDSYTDSETDALGHDWQETSRTEAKCEQDGSIRYVCSHDASHTRTEKIPATGHAYTDAVTPPACESKGYTTHTCTNCGDSYTDSETDALGHDWQKTSRTEAKCGQDGSIQYVCSHDASHTKTETITAAGHSYTDTVTPPTCESTGYTTHTCTNCGDSYTDSKTDALGHDWQETSRTEAKCEQDGSIRYTCTRNASHTKTETIPATGHTYSASVTLPTCTAGGYTTYTCSSCGDQYTDDFTFADGHSYRDGVCTVCGKVQFWDYTIRDGEATITGYSGDAVYLEIPAVLQGVPVTAIAERAFQQNDKIEFVAIPDCVRSVGSYAFSDCLGLKEVYIGEGVQQIGMRTFSGCGSLALVCVMSKTLSWNSTVFIGCDGRMMCVVPSGSAAHASAGATAPHCLSFTYPYEKKDGTRAIAFDGETTLYGDLEYHYWVRLVQKYPDVATLRFERLVFDGVDPDILGDEFSDSYVDRSADSLTLQNVYVSVEVQGEQITFSRLVELLEQGDISLAISFESEENERFSIFRAIGNYMRKVLHALSRLVSAIIRIFKKK